MLDSTAQVSTPRQPGALRLLADSELPTRAGSFRCVAFEAGAGGPTHLALIAGDVARDEVLVRVHSECLTGDTLGSRRCDCGEQLEVAMDLVAREGGVVVYLRGHEGRGIGLSAKLRAYALQSEGLDTVDANRALGLPVDARDYSPAAAILTELGVASVRLLTNNPDKIVALRDSGLSVSERIPLTVTPNPDNVAYLETKRDRLGHDL